MRFFHGKNIFLIFLLLNLRIKSLIFQGPCGLTQHIRIIIIPDCVCFINRFRNVPCFRWSINSECTCGLPHALTITSITSSTLIELILLQWNHHTKKFSNFRTSNISCWLASFNYLLPQPLDIDNPDSWLSAFLGLAIWVGLRPGVKLWSRINLCSSCFVPSNINPNALKRFVIESLSCQRMLLKIL